MIPGGHAILLTCTIDPIEDRHIATWVRQSPDTRSLARKEHHVTVKFLGRDLSDDAVDKVVAFGCTCWNLVPRYLCSNGSIRLFGRNRDHVVLMVDASHSLSKLRDHVEAICAKSGLDTRDSFGFNPHVTIAHCEPGAELPYKLKPHHVRINELVYKCGNEYINLAG